MNIIYELWNALHDLKYMLQHYCINSEHDLFDDVERKNGEKPKFQIS
jgi:hypothetical protein